MHHVYAPSIVDALNVKLPAGYWSRLDPAVDETVDPQITILRGQVDTGVAVQLGLDGMCSVTVWNEDAGTITFGVERPPTAVDVIVFDVLAAIGA